MKPKITYQQDGEGWSAEYNGFKVFDASNPYLAIGILVFTVKDHLGIELEQTGAVNLRMKETIWTETEQGEQ